MPRRCAVVEQSVIGTTARHRCITFLVCIHKGVLSRISQQTHNQMPHNAHLLFIAQSLVVKAIVAARSSHLTDR